MPHLPAIYFFFLQLRSEGLSSTLGGLGLEVCSLNVFEPLLSFCSLRHPFVWHSTLYTLHTLHSPLFTPRSTVYKGTITREECLTWCAFGFMGCNMLVHVRKNGHARFLRSQWQAEWSTSNFFWSSSDSSADMVNSLQPPDFKASWNLWSSKSDNPIPNSEVWRQIFQEMTWYLCAIPSLQHEMHLFTLLNWTNHSATFPYIMPSKSDDLMPPSTWGPVIIIISPFRSGCVQRGHVSILANFHILHFIVSPMRHHKHLDIFDHIWTRVKLQHLTPGSLCFVESATPRSISTRAIRQQDQGPFPNGQLPHHDILESISNGATYATRKLRKLKRHEKPREHSRSPHWGQYRCVPWTGVQ